MKKLNVILIAIAAVLLSACEYNEKNFPGFDGNTPSDVKTLDYTLTDADYKTISGIASNLAIAQANGASTELAALATAKMFNPALSAQDYIPAFLASLYPSADAGSAVRVTYNYKNGSQGFYKLTSSDYTEIWEGVSTVGALTPSKAAGTVLPELLTEKYPTAKEGDVKVVEYEYSEIEPEVITGKIDFIDDFESYASGTGAAVPATDNFMMNKDLKGTRAWECRAYSGNQYAQVTSNGSNSENEIWLITKEIDLTGAVSDLVFSFDINAGYYNANILSILVSEDFDGTQTGIATATWTDISSNFTIPDEPSSGYGVLSNAGEMDFAAYAGKNVFIAFKYNGNGIDNAATTTYQLDNLYVSYIGTATVTGDKATQFAYAKFSGGIWTLDNTKSIYQLANEDYQAMGKTTLATVDAPNYLPSLLQIKFPYAQQGDTKVVVYKTANTANNADEYVYENGIWLPESFVETRTDQFIKGNNGNWVFDPTVNYTLVTADYKIMVDYIMENKPEFEDRNSNYDNEEFYFGFGSRYSNISLRLSYRERYLQYDTELAAAATDADKVAVLWERLEEGMSIFLQQKFPEAQSEVSGIPVYYNITALVYCPDGTTSSGSVNYTWKYKVLTAGTPTASATFEYVSVNPQ